MISNGWFWCCGNKVQKVSAATTIIGEIYCRKCKREHGVVIIAGKIYKEVLI